MSGVESSTVLKAAEILRAGGVIVYPTETVYGIGCDPWNQAAVDRVFRIKRRDRERAMLLLADSRDMAERELGMFTGSAARLAESFWPGSLTMVLRPSRAFPDYLYGPTGGIALRVAVSALCRDLISAFGRPIVSTSANVSGKPVASSYGDAVEQFGTEADLVVKGEGMLGVPSTVIDMTSGIPVLIREGAVPFSRIVEAARL